MKKIVGAPYEKRGEVLSVHQGTDRTCPRNHHPHREGAGGGRMRVEIEYQDQFGSWKHFQTKHNEADAFRVASRRAQNTGKRHRLLSADGSLLDLINP